MIMVLKGHYMGLTQPGRNL